MNCVGAATCRCATSHFSFMILPIATRADIATHAVAYALGLTMAFQRKKPAAIGIKAPFPGSSNPRSPRPSRKSRAANAGFTRSSSMVTLMCQASSAIFRKRFVQSLPRRVKNFTAALARWTWSRKAHLRKIIDGTDIQYSDSFEVEGKEMYAHACKVGLEGVVSKVRDSPYTSGRGNDWVKKTCAQRERLIIAGFALDGRKWDGLYLARRKGEDLIYAGRLVSTKRHTSR